MNQNPHDIQKYILKHLLFTKDSRFTDMVPKGMTTDHFNFHVKRLVEENLIVKNEKGTYELSLKGKEYANRFDTDSKEMVFEKQAKTSVLIAAVRIRGDGTKEYLFQKRLKQPFFGVYAFLGGKIKYGESIVDAAKRELMEESGLEGDIELFCIEHRTDISTECEVLEDKFFYAFRATNIRGILLEKFDSGENKWLTKEEISNTKEKHEGTMWAVEQVENHTGNPIFREIINKTDKF